LSKSSEKQSMRPGGAAIKFLPRIISFAFSQLFLAKRIRRKIGKIETRLKEIDIENIKNDSPEEIFSRVEELKVVVKEIAFFNIVTPLLMGFHDRMLKRHLERMEVDYLNFDLLNDFPEIDDYDPNHSLQILNEMFQKLPKKLQQLLLNDPDYNGSTTMEGLRDFRAALEEFLNNFGHFSDSGNDFSYTPWRENKEFVIKMIASFEPSIQAGAKVSIGDLENNFLAKTIFNHVYKQARKFRMLREKVSSNYIFGYGIFRYYFLALGKYLVEKKVLKVPEEIYYLDEFQVRAAFRVGNESIKHREIIEFHKNKMKEQADVSPPELIYGDNEPILEPKADSEYSGVPASAGFYRGKVCVVKGTQDFEKLSNGDVLIIPFSDVGWTPLFPKAGAVISESGGMLSHCAIIAREYGIPSIVSVNGVMGLKDEQVVTVDANAGKLYVEKG